MRDLYEKNKNIVPYIIFGVLTTVVNLFTYFLFAYLFKCGTMPSTVAAWIIAVFFAYITNRKWVFKSDVANAFELLKEMFSFFMCRLATGAVDWVCMYVSVDQLHMNDVVMKAAANVIVIVLNYIASKNIIFKRMQNVENIDR